MKKFLSGVAIAAALAGCSGDDETDVVDTDVEDTDVVDTDVDDTDVEASLYDQLGGEAAVRLVIGEFLTVVLADDRINWFFANADGAALGDALHDQICAATGGGCTYTGDMKAIHAGMAITDAQFDALVEDLLQALDNLGVEYALDGSQPIDPLLLALVGMKADIVEDAAGDQVYFNRLGGYGTIEVVVDDFVGNVAADARINGFFAETDIPRLKTLLVEQICDATGGYCTYSGRTMKEAHEGMCVSDADFDALVEDLLTTFDDLSVPYTPGTFDGGALADDLIVVLAGMRGDIVENCP